MISRVAFLSYHTCPLVPPGSGDAGGMNVYINELASMMVTLGVGVDVFTRRTGAEDLGVVEAPGGYRVVHVTAGPYERLPKVASAPFLAPFAESVAEFNGGYDLLHSHYWLSGQVGWLASERWDVPLVHSMHTMAKVKNRMPKNASKAKPTGISSPRVSQKARFTSGWWRKDITFQPMARPGTRKSRRLHV